MRAEISYKEQPKWWSKWWMFPYIVHIYRDDQEYPYGRLVGITCTLHGARRLARGALRYEAGRKRERTITEVIK